jgi:serine/threonine protein kinase
MQALKSSILLEPGIVPEYASVFIEHGVPFKETAFYLHVSENVREQGWILHLSIVLGKYFELIEAILPVLLELGLTFKVIKNSKIHEAINNGYYGEWKVGKVVTIYIEHETIIDSLVPYLVDKTSNLGGPPILGDFKIGKILYTRYGSFRAEPRIDNKGYLHRMIMTPEGKWLNDKYQHPPKIPSGVSNPFKYYINLPSSATIVKNLENKYKINKKILSEIGCEVYDSKFRDNKIQKGCRIKWGIRYMMVDLEGRDMVDRIKWQYQISLKLYGKIPIPKMLEYFEDESNAVAVMEKIGETDLESVIKDIFDFQSGHSIGKSGVNKIIMYSLEILDIIEETHKLGYIIRDIHPGNFIIDSNDSINLVDLELFYPANREISFNPFNGGKKGYISPEQSEGKNPSFKDDIYSFGALLLFMLTNLPPYLVIEKNNEALEVKINAIVSRSIIADLIISCLDNISIQRPSIETIREVLQKYYNELKSFTHINLYNPRITKSNLTDILRQGLKGLGSSQMLQNDLWPSPIVNEYDTDVYPQMNSHILSFIHRGVGGVLYVLCKCFEIEIDISHLESPIEKAWKFIKTNTLEKIEDIAPGLHYGASGLAVLLAKAVGSGFLQKDLDSNKIILKCLQKDNRYNDIIYGRAGDGLAILQCANVLEAHSLQSLIGPRIMHLINTQESDGSWKENESGNPLVRISTGFGYGVAGITYFLLECSCRYPHFNSILPALRGIEYLDSTALRENGFLRWPVNDLRKKQSSWWCRGGAGIALTYLKAFELTGTIGYMRSAEIALRSIPKQLINKNLSQCHGMSGLGEIYLEAFRITRNEEWLERALDVAYAICALRFTPSPGSCYWLVENCNFPSADLMIGNGGIIHFLMRILYPEKIFFPLLPEPIQGSKIK